MSSDQIKTTVRDQFVSDGRMADRSWEDWCVDLNKLAAANPDRYGTDAIENCGADCWRNYYDDGYSADDAWAEDGTYD